MTKKQMTQIDDLFRERRKDPRYVAEYDGRDAEFSLPAAVIAARAHAGLTQAELSKRMGTTQSVIARLESGLSKPSTTTLEKLAKATGTRLKIAFEPADV